MSSFREESTMIPQELLVPFRVVWRNFLSSGGSHLPQSATALYRTEPSARPSPCSVVVVCWVLPDAATAYKNGFVRRQCTESGKFFTFKNYVLKPNQNKKGQKNLGYPTKKQSFYKEKDCFFVGYPKFFWPFLFWLGFKKKVLLFLSALRIENISNCFWDLLTFKDRQGYRAKFTTLWTSFVKKKIENFGGSS